jgi:RimJ/RimL family protein N-acetyltransferase
MGWRVRRARESDGAAIARIRVASWRMAYAGVVPDDALAGMRPVAATWERTAVAAPPTALFVTVDDADEPVAFSLVGEARQEADRLPDKRTGELWAIYADPAALGTGAGRAAHDAGMAHLADLGFDHAVVWVLRDNPIGRRFYEANGWQPDGGTTELTIGGRPLTELRYARSPR